MTAVSRICGLATGSPFSGFHQIPEFEITVEERHARDQAWWQMIELSCVTEAIRKDPALMSQLASAQQSDIQEFYDSGDPKTLRAAAEKHSIRLPAINNTFTAMFRYSHELRT